MAEKRYAILIGMDNYSSNPLPYSSKDVEDLKKVLIENCRFEENNIYTIIDSKISVKEQIDKSFKEIEDGFRKKEDLFLFYFSGHGEYDKNEEASKIIFEDESNLSIEDILFRYFGKITPKNQYLLIDSCHSGSNVFIKSKESKEKQIRRLNYLSHEFCLMFATEKKNKAIQNTDLQNSYFTYFFIEAIKETSNYDDDGFLTIQSIDNIIKKKVLEKSNNVQIPVSEIRSSGYKVFAFDEKTTEKKLVPKKKKNSKTKSNKPEIQKINFEESLSLTNRIKAQQQVTTLVEHHFEKLIPNLKTEDITINHYTSFDHIEPDNQQVLYREIINKVKSEGIEAIEGVLNKDLVERRKPKFDFGLTSIIDNLYEQAKSDYNYYIDLYSEHVNIRYLEVKSATVYKVSGAILIIIFQTKYGFAIGTIILKYSWTGTEDDKLSLPEINIYPFLLSYLDESEVEVILSETTNEFLKSLKTWNEKRNSDIEKYINKVSSRKVN